MIRREAPIQRAIVDYLRTLFPEALVHHARNEINKRGKHIAIELANAKRAGAVKGFPDILLLLYANVGPMFFEVKAEGNYPTSAQKDVHKHLRDLGYRVAVVRSIDDVQAKLVEWGVTPSGGWQSIGSVAKRVLQGAGE